MLYRLSYVGGDAARGTFTTRVAPARPEPTPHGANVKLRSKTKNPNRPSSSVEEGRGQCELEKVVPRQLAVNWKFGLEMRGFDSGAFGAYGPGRAGAGRGGPRSNTSLVPQKPVAPSLPSLGTRSCPPRPAPALPCVIPSCPRITSPTFPVSCWDLHTASRADTPPSHQPRRTSGIRTRRPSHQPRRTRDPN